jgi:diphthine synthase
MLYLIGLGLNVAGISKQGLEAVNKCERVYLEFYTTDFPYSKEELEKILARKVILADRDFVESLKIIEEAKNKDIALLVYGSPLTATTHISLIQEAEKQNIKTKIIHNASILDAVAETGLQPYKFGKVASIPNFEAESFIEIVKDNLGIGAHTLILTDIGMEFEDALKKLIGVVNKQKIDLDKLIICSQIGTKNSKIYYSTPDELKNKKVKKPFCFIVPGKLHFVEEEVLTKHV